MKETQETRVSFLGWEGPLEEEMATHSSRSSLVAQTVENSPEMQETMFDPWVGKIWRREWQPTPVFLPGEIQGQRSLVGCCLWGHTESEMTEVT